MLRWRLLLGTLFVVALIALGWLDHRGDWPGLWLAPVVVLIAMLATGEILHLQRLGGARPLGAVVYFGNLAILAACWWKLGFGDPSGFSLEGPALALALAVLALFVGEMRRYEKPGGITANLAAGCFGLVYVGLLLAVVVLLRLRYGIAALATLLIVVKMGDIGAYTVGRLVGRHKMAPKLSPGKTIEGAAGAIVFSTAAAAACFTWLVPALSDLAPQTASVKSLWAPIVFGIAVGATGIAGDLAESLLKRDVGQKDSSAWMPGFGGVLDLVDSVLIAAPVAMVAWQLIG